MNKRRKDKTGFEKEALDEAKEIKAAMAEGKSLY